jgi:hypothetical protein
MPAHRYADRVSTYPPAQRNGYRKVDNPRLLPHQTQNATDLVRSKSLMAVGSTTVSTAGERMDWLMWHPRWTSHALDHADKARSHALVPGFVPSTASRRENPPGRNVDRKALALKAGTGLPYEVDRLEERKKLFMACDPNGNGLASFAEIDSVFREKYGFGEKEKMKILHAFDACSNIGGKETGPAADYIEHKEFRKFLETVVRSLGGVVDETRCRPTGHAMLGNQVHEKGYGSKTTSKAGPDLPFQPNRHHERDQLFSKCDPNGNKLASFAEIDAVFRREFGFGEKEKMPMLRAYDACKSLGGETGTAAEYIEHKEFRKFLELVDKNLKHDKVQDINLSGVSMSKSASVPNVR